MLKIYPVLCRAGTMDNYAYILQDGATGISAVLDPSEPQPIIQKLDELGLEPQYILNTHHHFDHTDGNLELKQRYKAQVVANANDASRIPGFDIGVAPGSTFMLGQSPAEIIDVSAHTQGTHPLVFSPRQSPVYRDTLFNLASEVSLKERQNKCTTPWPKSNNFPTTSIFILGMNIPWGAPILPIMSIMATAI